MFAARTFLALVGAAYILLGIWCAVQPAETSRTVGFTLVPGAGDSEFLTVYGGLEVALGLVFLWPVLAPADTVTTIRICLIVHASLVVFRTIGFMIFSGIPTMTYSLAAVEWIIFLGSLAIWRVVLK